MSTGSEHCPKVARLAVALVTTSDAPVTTSKALVTRSVALVTRSISICLTKSKRNGEPRNKKLLVTSATLVVTSALLVGTRSERRNISKLIYCHNRTGGKRPSAASLAFAFSARACPRWEDRLRTGAPS